MCGMNCKLYLCEDQMCLSTYSKSGRLGYLVDVNCLAIIRRDYSYHDFISRVRISALVSDWIISRKYFWRRKAFINFLLLWSLFVLFFYW